YNESKVREGNDEARNNDEKYCHPSSSLDHSSFLRHLSFVLRHWPSGCGKDLRMRIATKNFTVATTGKGTYEVTDQIEALVRESKIENGVVTIFVQHTSCSLIVMENADPTARRDLEEYFDRLVPENADYFEHDSE